MIRNYKCDTCNEFLCKTQDEDCLGGYKHCVVKNKRKRVSVTCSIRANIMSQSGIYSTYKSALLSGDLKSVNATDQIQSNNVLR